MKRRRFKDPLLQAMYDQKLANGDPSGGAGVAGEAFCRGYSGSRCLWPRGSLGYAAWAAGKDRRTADLVRSAYPRVDGNVIRLATR